MHVRAVWALPVRGACGPVARAGREGPRRLNRHTAPAFGRNPFRSTPDAMSRGMNPLSRRTNAIQGAIPSIEALNVGFRPLPQTTRSRTLGAKNSTNRPAPPLKCSAQTTIAICSPAGTSRRTLRPHRSHSSSVSPSSGTRQSHIPSSPHPLMPLSSVTSQCGARVGACRAERLHHPRVTQLGAHRGEEAGALVGGGAHGRCASGGGLRRNVTVPLRTSDFVADVDLKTVKWLIQPFWEARPTCRTRRREVAARIGVPRSYWKGTTWRVQYSRDRFCASVI